MTGDHYFADFPVGRTFRSRPFRMERDRMVAFAREFDTQPQHMSERAAASSQFGRLVASGWHTAAVSMRLFISEASPPIAGGGQGMGVEAMSWPRPMLPGDTLHVVAEVMTARTSRSRRDKGVLSIRNTMFNQHGEIVHVATHALMVPVKAPA